MVDFPTPEDPMNAEVFPSVIYGYSTSKSKSFMQLVTKTSAPEATADMAESLLSKSEHKSDFVRTITGVAPLLQAIAR